MLPWAFTLPRGVREGIGRPRTRPLARGVLWRGPLGTRRRPRTPRRPEARSGQGCSATRTLPRVSRHEGGASRYGMSRPLISRMTSVCCAGLLPTTTRTFPVHPPSKYSSASTPVGWASFGLPVKNSIRHRRWSSPTSNNVWPRNVLDAALERVRRDRQHEPVPDSRLQMRVLVVDVLDHSLEVIGDGALIGTNASHHAGGVRQQAAVSVTEQARRWAACPSGPRNAQGHQPRSATARPRTGYRRPTTPICGRSTDGLWFRRDHEWHQVPPGQRCDECNVHVP